MTSSITWRRWRGPSCGRGLRKKSLDSNQRKSASTLPRRRARPGLMKQRRIAPVPRLARWPSELKRERHPAEPVERVLGDAVAQTRAFAELRGQRLFGSGVGYIIDYDPTGEFVYLQRAR